MNPIKNPFRKMKRNRVTIDELSLFLIANALILSILLILFGLSRFILLAWIPLLAAYWRIYSKNRMQRERENQIFVNYYSSINSWIKRFLRRARQRETHIYFECKSCTQQLRIPKKTDNIKITCPKCNYSFIKKTIRGFMSKFGKKIA